MDRIITPQNSLGIAQISVPFHGTKLVCRDFQRHRIFHNGGPMYTRCQRGKILKNFWGDGVDALVEKDVKKTSFYERKPKKM